MSKNTNLIYFKLLQNLTPKKNQTKNRFKLSLVFNEMYREKEKKLHTFGMRVIILHVNR